MNHENQSGEREKQETWLFILLILSYKHLNRNKLSNQPLSLQVPNPTNFILTEFVTLHLSENLSETGLQFFSSLLTRVQS